MAVSPRSTIATETDYTVVFSTSTEGLRTIVESKVGELETSNLTASGIAAMSCPLGLRLEKVWTLF